MSSGSGKTINLSHSAFGLVEIWKKSAGLGRISKLEMSWHLVKQALRSMAASPLTSLLCLLTISVVLFMLSAFELAVENSSDFFGLSRTKVTISLFLKDSASEAQKDHLIAEIKALPEVSSAVYRSKDSALAEFRKSLGDQSVILEGLEGANPLPASVEVSFAKDRLAQTVFDTFEKRFSKSEIIEHVQYNRGLVGQLDTVMRFFKRAWWFSMLLMLLVSSFIIANTIRLALYSRSDEISIMRLVGATTGFVRAPCLIEGAVHGLLGAAIALISLYLVFSLLISVFQGLGFFQLIASVVHFLSWWYQLLVFLAGILVGLAGSYIAVRRFVDE